MPFIISIEIIAFYAFLKRTGISVGFKIGVLSVVIANVAISSVGLFIPGPYRSGVTLWFLEACILSIVIEALVYELTIKQGLRKSLTLSSFLNVLSYAIVFIMYTIKTSYMSLI